MKRFLMFLVILIAAVSLGLTIYYFSVDNEFIYIKSSYLVINPGESIVVREGRNDLLDFRNKADSTTLTYTVEQPEDDKILNYNETEGYITAEKGGQARIVVSTSNRLYSKLVVDVLVCDGSEEYPFMIKNEEELKNLDSSKSYKLSNDIELTENWVPIPSYSGVFDGNHFTISKMTVTSNEVTVNAGFISVLSGTVKNLFLKDINIDVNNAQNVGSIAGELVGTGIIQTSEVTGTITNSKTSGTSTTGGIAGRTDNVDLKTRIDRCGFDGTLNVTGSQITAGGIVGVNKGRITESYSRAKVNNGTRESTKFGGIVGENQNGSNNIYDCYFYAKENLTSPQYAAGIIYYQKSKALVTGCYYGGKISELSNGLIASNESGVALSSANGYLNDTVTTGFKNSRNFITTKGAVADSNGQKYDRPWNFNGVWTLRGDYPELNVYSSVGSTYVIDTSNISTDSTIDSAEKLYNAVKANKKDYDIKTDIDMSGFVWVPVGTSGKTENQFNNDADSKTEFKHAIISSIGATIKNLTIDATDLPDGADVGLVQRAGSGAIFSGLKFDNVKIITRSDRAFRNVGVLAGTSNGAVVSNLTIRTLTVGVTGSVKNYSAFGSLFGYAGEGTVVNRVDIHDVDVRSGYYVYAGGIAGISYATITSNGNVNASGTTNATKLYNYVNGLQLIANFAGGVVGANAGAIGYTAVNNFSFNNGGSSNSVHTTTIYDAQTKTNVFVGGIIGINEYVQNGVRTKGVVVSAYSYNSNIRTLSGKNYKMYLGGIAGYNSGNISISYVKSVSIYVEGSQNAFAGGIAGYNNGYVNKCFVDAGSKIDTNVNASVGTSVDQGNYILNTNNCTIVGGIVGYDAQTTNNVYSIYQSASLMNTIKGYYAGGISGISFGKVGYSYCGESTKSGGGVSITGFFAGGLSAVVAGGCMVNCYTFCNLNSATGSFNYKNVLSVVRMEVSAVAGLTVFALNAGTYLEGCYAVTTLKTNGVSYGSSADLTGFVCGEVRNCVYQNAGSVATRNGKKLTKADLTGNNGFYNFKNAINPSGNNLGSWNFNSGNYPTLSGVNINNPSSNLPKFD